MVTEKQREYKRLWNLKNKEKNRIWQKEYDEKHREEKRKYHKEWRLKNWEKYATKRADQRLRVRYKIGLKDYDRMSKEQNNVCAICGDKVTDKRLRVDHNHTTGKVRGLLCVGCNIGIGAFKENINFMLSAVKYLQRYNNE